MTRLQFHLVSAIGVLLLALAPALLSPFSITLLNFIGIYALAVLGLVLLSGIGGMLSFGQAAFVGIAASDVSGSGSQTYWSLLAIVFGLICMGLDWVHEPPGTAWWKAALKTALHWVGVLFAIELVYYFIAAGRLTNADTGLLNGTILALGTFTSGAHTNWRLVVIGAALGIGTVVVAYVERYLWVLFALSLLALGAIVLVARLRGRRDEA